MRNKSLIEAHGYSFLNFHSLYPVKQFEYYSKGALVYIYNVWSIKIWGKWIIESVSIFCIKINAK